MWLSAFVLRMYIYIFVLHRFMKKPKNIQANISQGLVFDWQFCVFRGPNTFEKQVFGCLGIYIYNVFIMCIYYVVTLRFEDAHLEKMPFIFKLIQVIIQCDLLVFFFEILKAPWWFETVACSDFWLTCSECRKPSKYPDFRLSMNWLALLVFLLSTVST